MEKITLILPTKEHESQVLGYKNGTNYTKILDYDNINISNKIKTIEMRRHNI